MKLSDEQHIQIRSKMIALFERTNHLFSEQDRNDIWDFIQACEWEVGLDLILFLIEKKKVPVLKANLEEFYDIANQIGMDLEGMRKGWPAKD